MEQIAGSIITQYGALGMLLVIMGYVIVDWIKSRKSDKASDKKLNDIITNVTDIKQDIPIIKNKIEYVDERVDMIKDNLDEKIDMYNDAVTARIDALETTIQNNPQHVIDVLDNRAYNLSQQHNQQMINQIMIAPKIHNVMGDYINRIGCDHIFLGWFHNGTSSITGMPFYKFDIVAEKFHPESNSKDYEFGHMYKDVDILRHNKLPIELIQNKEIYYNIDFSKPDNPVSNLSSMDDILYRRMVGNGIHQIALRLISTDNGSPTGFVGCVQFDDKTLNLKELSNCAEDIADII